MQKLYQIYAWLFGFPGLARINSKLHYLTLRGMGLCNYQDLAISGERRFIDKVVRNLGSELIVFDVGANVGEYSTLLIKRIPSIKRLFAFEPHPLTFETLLANTAGMQKLECVNIALTDKTGEAFFYDRADKDGSSHASMNASIFSEVHQVDHTELMVTAMTLDEFCRVESVGYIDFLKIDVEGYELMVLKGAARMLQERKIRAIQFEFTQLNSVVGIFFKEFWNLMSPQYDIYRLLPHGLLPIRTYNPATCELFAYQNYVALRRD